MKFLSERILKVNWIITGNPFKVLGTGPKISSSLRRELWRKATWGLFILGYNFAISLWIAYEIRTRIIALNKDIFIPELA